jgi:hypothetical protein
MVCVCIELKMHLLGLFKYYVIQKASKVIKLALDLKEVRYTCVTHGGKQVKNIFKFCRIISGQPLPRIRMTWYVHCSELINNV